MLAALLAASAAAQAEPVADSDSVDSLRETRLGTFTFDLRLRYEFADIDGFDESHALTVRPRLGFGTKPWHGLSLFAEGEAIQALDEDEYYDGAGSPNGKAVVADPEDLELNQLFARWSSPRWGTATVGRQRIILDDARFVGNVGWRMNEQTYDAVRLESSLGRDDLALQYAYLDEVHRIFGNEGRNGRDFDASSHLVNLRYTGLPVTVTLFAYLLDFDTAPVFSSDSYGLRLEGAHALDATWKVTWFGSVATQTDGDANPVSYRATYGAVEGAVGHAEAGTVGVGYEHLGSDHGRARFVTPLATLHGFNGWADAFLDNGGLRGLQDVYAFVAPKLPWDLEGRLVLHQFWSAEGSDDLGFEVDVAVSKALTKRLRVLAKAAWLDGERGRANRTRAWLQTEYRF